MQLIFFAYITWYDKHKRKFSKASLIESCSKNANTLNKCSITFNIGTYFEDWFEKRRFKILDFQFNFVLHNLLIDAGIVIILFNRDYTQRYN